MNIAILAGETVPLLLSCLAMAAVSNGARHGIVAAIAAPCIALALLIDRDGHLPTVTAAAGMTTGALGVHLNLAVNRSRRRRRRKEGQAAGRISA